MAELMQHIAMSHPSVSISYIQNGQTKFFTSGNGNLSEIIYRIYGRDVSDNMIPVEKEAEGIRITGFIGKPVLARANRNYETFFINGRYIKSKIISLALEEGYKSFLMQHKYPFAVLHFEISGEEIDVNVHPTKMEVRIMEPQPFCEFVRETIVKCLSNQVLIPEYADSRWTDKESKKEAERELPPEPFETRRRKQNEEAGHEIEEETAKEPVDYKTPEREMNTLNEEIPRGFKILGNPEPKKSTPYKPREDFIRQDETVMGKAVQMEMFERGLEQAGENRLSQLKIIGQVFGTYWIIQFDDKIYFVDQHAAHEKVYYEKWMQKLEAKENTTQMLMPPLIISLNGREMTVLKKFEDFFVRLGYEIETFGGDEIALRGVPQDLYGVDEKQLFLDALDELVGQMPLKGTPEIILSKLASMSCKAAVKGNRNLSPEEARELLKQLFSLENPYHCPHGRPTMFSMSKYELEKRFKRIL